MKIERSAEALSRPGVQSYKNLREAGVKRAGVGQKTPLTHPAISPSLS